LILLVKNPKKEEEAEAKRKYDAGQASLLAGDVSQSRRKNKEIH